MHDHKKTKKNWLNKYKVKKVYFGDKFYKLTLIYLKKQKYLSYFKILYLLKSFVIKKEPICNILIYDKKIVGFVGTFFSKKIFSDKGYLVCNIHSWLVDINHRIAATLLLKKIYERKCLISVLSSLPELRNTFLKMGFNEYDLNYKIVFIKRLFIGKHNSNFQILQKGSISNIIIKKFHQLFKHYSDKKYKIFFFRKKNEKKGCLIISNIIYKKKVFKTLNIIYSSNPKYLKSNLKPFFDQVNTTFNVTTCGEYFLKNNNSLFGKNFNISLKKKKRIYLKFLPKKFIFDLLYSEVEF